MARRLTRPIATVLALAALAGPAAAYTARNGLRVEPLGAQGFRVAYGGKSGAAAFWCAAGDYAQRQLGLDAADRIWRVTPVPRRTGEGMVFSTRPDNAAEKTGLVIVLGRKGASLTVAAAVNYCNFTDR